MSMVDEENDAAEQEYQEFKKLCEEIADNPSLHPTNFKDRYLWDLEQEVRRLRVK